MYYYIYISQVRTSLTKMTKTIRELVYEITSRIPKGKVATYGQIARLVGKPKAARMVGHYMKVNPHAPRVPCHRVVASNGALTGYSLGGVEVKHKLLQKEGVEFIGDRVNLLKSQWKTV